MLEGLGAGWTASFLAKVYPGLSRYLMKELLKTITNVSIVVILGLVVCVVCTGCTSVINGDNAWKIRKIDKFIPLPRADERECEEVRHETVHKLLY